MEERKKRKPDLEASRPVFFLLGMVFVLSLCYVAMEYRSVPTDWELDDALLDDVARDLTFRPKPIDKDWVAAPHTRVNPKPAVATRLKAVDEAVSKKAKLPSRSSLLQEGNEEAAVAEAKVAESLPRQEETAGQADERLSQLPEFPGGWSEMVKWLTKNLRYPPQAQASRLQGKVVVSFIVGTDGKLSQVKVAKSVHPQLDREALRVVRKMPPWKPGTEGGKPCRSMVVVPVVFKL